MNKKVLTYFILNLGFLLCVAATNDVVVIDCTTTPWSNWSDCCMINNAHPKHIVGTRYRYREFRNPEETKDCDEKVLEYELCSPVNSCACHTTDWSDWGPCTAACGSGVRVRTRSYIHPGEATKANCDVTLVSTTDCFVECRETPYNATDPCETTDWSQWSACNTECGPGIQVRTRSYINQKEAQKSNCTLSLVNSIDCYNECYSADAICRLPGDPGPCDGRFHMHYYDAATKKCISFIYGGCQGNRNKFSRKEECKRFCNGVAITMTNEKNKKKKP